MQSVVIVQRRLPHYREALFERMRERLAADGIRLRLLHGQATRAEESKRDAGHLDWAEALPNTYLFGDRLCWQRFNPQVRDASLVVMGQENKLVYNLLAMSIERPARLAYWGHGRDMQAVHPNGIGERFKKWLAVKVDWWFAYTTMTRDIVAGYGFPSERITVLDNAVDTSALATQLRAVTADSVAAQRKQLAIGDGPVALYIGSLYADKRLDFLLQAADALRERIATFTLIVVGDGPLRGTLDSAAATRPWLHVLGAQRGADKARLLKLADVMLNPGLVGLGILDSFVAGVPMITTDCRIHSPEIAYLDSGVNGVMTINDLHAYVDAVASLLRLPGALDAVARGAARSAEHYTVENTAGKYCEGIHACMEGAPTR